jgi:hypothetical protein
MRGLIAAALLLLAQRAPLPLSEYRDTKSGISFAYPTGFGTVAPGTNDGFQGRRAFRFAAFPAVLGGELVLTRGFPYVDIQAVGGLYDSIALEVFPDPLRRRIVTLLPRLNAANFCDALGRATHLDTDARTPGGFSEAERTAIRNVDLFRSIDPKVIRCGSVDGVIVFDREAAFQPGAPRQHIFGAIRFLDGDVSSVQLVSGDTMVRPGVLESMTAIVRSVAFTSPAR